MTKSFLCWAVMAATANWYQGASAAKSSNSKVFGGDDDMLARRAGIWIARTVARSWPSCTIFKRMFAFLLRHCKL